MDIILLQRIKNLGKLGDKVSVKAGYGRNFLILKVKQLLRLKQTLLLLKLVVLNLRSKKLKYWLLLKHVLTN